MDAQPQLPCWHAACPWRGDTFTEVADHHYTHHRRPDPPPLVQGTGTVIGYAAPEPRRVWTDVRLLARPVGQNGAQGGTHGTGV
jgi:hypothetical protein